MFRFFANIEIKYLVAARTGKRHQYLCVMAMEPIQVSHSIKVLRYEPFPFSHFYTNLVGGFNPPLENISQIGSSSQVGVKINNL